MPAPKYRALSETTVKTAGLVGDKTARTITDGEGLELLIESKKAKADGEARRIVKTWRFFYYRPGKFNAKGKPLKNTMIVGTYPATSLDAARARAVSLNGKVQAGIDPVVEIAQTKAKAARDEERKVENEIRAEQNLPALPGDGTVRAMCEETHAFYTVPNTSIEWSPGYASNWIAAMRNHLYAPLGERQVADLEGDELLAVLETLPTANMRWDMRRAVQQSIAYWIAKGTLKTRRNVAQEIAPLVHAPVSTKHPRIKDPRVLGRLYAAILADTPAVETVGKAGEKRAIALAKTFKCAGWEFDAFLNASALRIQMLVWQRGGMVNAMEWAEVEFDHPVGPRWTVPAAKMKLTLARKRGKDSECFDHVIPLTPTLVAILRDLQKVTGHRKFVFSRLRNRDVAMGPSTMLKYLKKHLTSLGQEGASDIHGFRGMAQTMALNHCPAATRESTECHLAHIPPGLGKTYNDASYVAQRLQMLLQWDEFITGEARKVTAAANASEIAAAA
jgi:integrase